MRWIMCAGGNVQGKHMERLRGVERKEVEQMKWRDD